MDCSSSGAAGRAVIWDLNGVIIDDMQFHLRSFQEFLRTLGHGMTEQYFVEKCTGTPPTEVFADILPALGNPVSIDEAVDRKRAIYFELIHGNMAMLAGVRSLIDGLNQSRFVQAIASGATRVEVEAILDEFGIRAFFEAVVACEDVSKGKPDPEPFATAAAALRCEPSRCVVIEDGEYGIRAAQAAGMKCIAVTNTHPANRLSAADLVVATLEEVDADVVEQLLAD